MKARLVLSAALLALLVPSLAAAVCPGNVQLLDQLYCSSEIDTFVDHTAASELGGECASGLCYACGEPFDEQDQIAPEAVYSFVCQVTGEVTLLITNLTCDLDIYVLDNSCDPYTGCVQGSTASFALDDQVTFTCTAGAEYYVVVEAYGTAHLDIASGPCTDAAGDVYSPDYTLSFDVSASTGCNEDCDDGLDNDLDGAADCADSDCGSEDVCCDLDDDGYFSMECGGPDCDDSDVAVNPAATEVLNGYDDDCDGLIDEGTDAYDDDGDGFSENDGDCDDNNDDVFPGADEVCGNALDDDCDGDTDGADDDCDEFTDDDGDGYSEADGDCDDGDAAISPDADEICDNGVDDDCDGFTDEDDDDCEEPVDDDDAVDDDDSAMDDDDTGDLDPPDDDDDSSGPDTFGCGCGDCESSVGGHGAGHGLLVLLAFGAVGLRRHRR
jgi:hypothetical protein